MPLFFLNGELAVWIFFIVSGFSLSIGYVMSGDRSVLMRIAYGRYLRLAIPILVFSFFTYAAFKFGLVPPADSRPDRLKNIVTQPPSLMETIAFSLFNVFFNYNTSTSLMPQLWTMQIEFAGSFLVLGLCALGGNRKWAVAFNAFVFLVCFFYKPYYSAFISGVLFAKLYSRALKFRGALVSSSLFILGACLAFFLPQAPERAYLIVSIILFAGMIYVQPIKCFLECNLSKFMGRISYTLYLVHTLVMGVFSLPLVIHCSKYDDTSRFLLLISINVASIVISVGLSWLLVGIDEYSVSVSRKFSKAIIFITKKHEPSFLGVK